MLYRKATKQILVAKQNMGTFGWVTALFAHLVNAAKRMISKTVIDSRVDIKRPNIARTFIINMINFKHKKASQLSRQIVP